MTQSRILVLDGGLATELERRGQRLQDALWSARLLIESADEIAAVHDSYLNAGADCITTASYQATVHGFESAGLDSCAAEQLIRHSVRLAQTQRDQFWSNPANRIGRSRPMVAASVGPYGAFMANGAEYTGRYDLDSRGLMEFHRDRWRLLADENPDVMLCETIPSWSETQVLADLANEFPEIPTWISFCCLDSGQLGDGTPIDRCVQFLNAIPSVVAIGVNCVSPHSVATSISIIRAETTKEIVVFPNSGETWDALNKSWQGNNSTIELANLAVTWRRLGASMIGGCCRTGPDQTRQIRQALCAPGQ